MVVPYFSVIIPVYNRADIIVDTLRSVLAQSFQDFEVLIIDDGSTDDVAGAIASVGDDRVRLLHQRNAGANAARNHGIMSARGEYVAFLDSDDRFLAHHLQSAADLLRTDPNVVIYAQVIVDRGDGVSLLKPPRGIRRDEHMSEYLFCGRGFLQTSTLVLPASLARRIRYDELLPFGQDTDLAIRLFAAGARFRMLPNPSSIWSDLPSSDRVSNRQDPAVRARWVESVRTLITHRAYVAFKGWYLAKAYARTGSTVRGLRLYLAAVCARAYPPRLAIAVGLQVLAPPAAYRQLADTFLRFRRRPKV